MKSFNPTIKGIICGIAMIIAALINFYIFHQPVDSSYQYIVYAIYGIGIVWSIYDFSKQVSSDTKFKEYFSAGFKTFIVITLLMVIYTAIFHILNPQILESKIALNNVLVAKEGNHTPVEIEENAKQMRSIFIPMMSAVTTFIYLFLGALISAVTSGVIMQIKRN